MKKCRFCKELFLPTRPLQVVCSIACALADAKRKTLKAQKAEQAAEKKLYNAQQKADKAKRERMKTRRQWIEEAQRAFNAFIRARDAGKPCICCGQYSQGAGRDRGGEWDAGHFRSRGAAPEVRFDERNVHAQLKQCNRRAWDVASYRANLIQRIGLAEVEALEGPHPSKKYTIAELTAIKTTYAARARELKRAQA